MTRALTEIMLIFAAFVFFVGCVFDVKEAYPMDIDCTVSATVENAAWYENGEIKTLLPDTWNDEGTF